MAGDPIRWESGALHVIQMFSRGLWSLPNERVQVRLVRKRPVGLSRFQRLAGPSRPSRCSSARFAGIRCDAAGGSPDWSGTDDRMESDAGATRLL